MSEKQELPYSAHPDEEVRGRRAGPSPLLQFLRLAGCAALIFTIYRLVLPQLYRWEPSQPAQNAVLDSISEDYVIVDEANKVPLEAHIMSKCPDALVCLQSLILPTMANISSEIDFTLSYIGTPTDNDDGVSCKHGQTECLGNMLELCAADLYPDPKIYLGFTMCMTKHYADIPDRELVSDCALEHGIDFARLNDCVSRDDGAYALDLLRSSFERSANVGATKSCTVRLDGKVRCIRDGGEWKECDEGSSPEELIRDVDALYNDLNEE
ncbi:gamma interferon inducible lysosomal thiol reductase [Saccharata proteae CBS 121410]|uniref:Gamma interferon inducible lysosomal thiol reductase n=1 Tax=Saccharata proteae CBS 121410 TaxID=1314787 RepID=A0A9P4HNH1_9PEZI|nr:gamma interferon inducible lysosomal thiol reductase [Saccharata proteae CBS 121410]